MKLAISILLTNACFFMSTCSERPTALELVLQQGELTVVSRNSATTFYLGSEGPRGFEYELARGFADELGVELNMYSADSLLDIVDDLTSHRADIAAAGLTVTDDRRAVLRFTQAHRDVTQQLVYRLGQRRPRSPADLVGKRIEVSAGSSFVATLAELAAQTPGLSWREVDSADVEELLLRVVNKEIDYTVVDSNEFQIVGQFYPQLRVAFDISARTQLAWAMRAGFDHSLYHAAEDYLDRARRDGTIARLDERYYDNEHRLDYVGTRQFLRHIQSRLPAYRPHFEAAARQHGFDWRLLAAMSYQESHWNPKAVSPTGVRGLMMLTRATARQLGIADRTDPLQSIRGGARYLARIKRKIPERIAEPDRTWMALAAYNVGFLHLEDARILTQIHARDPDDWEAVREHLPLLAQKKWHSRVRRGYARGWEPVKYVDNVRSYYDILIWATSDQYRETIEARVPRDTDSAPETGLKLVDADAQPAL